MTGNDRFKQGKFRLSIELYSTGIKDRIADVHELALLHLNRAASHLALSNFASAYHDAECALEFLASDDKGHREKALVCRARALEGLRSLTAAAAAYQTILDESPENADAIAGLANTQELLEQSKSGTYDWAALIKTGGSASTKVDIADFRGPSKVVERAESGGGRGVFTTRDVKAGELLVVEKAFGVAYHVPEAAQRFVYDVQRETLRTPADLELAGVISAKLLDNPQLAESIYSLNAGPNFPAPTSPADLFGAEPAPPVRATCFIDPEIGRAHV